MIRKENFSMAHVNTVFVGIKKMEISVGGRGGAMPPSEIKQNETTETCEGSKYWFLGMPSSSRQFPVG